MINTHAKRALLANKTYVVAALMRMVNESTDLDRPGVGPIVTASLTPELSGSANSIARIERFTLTGIAVVRGLTLSAKPVPSTCAAAHTDSAVRRRIVEMLPLDVKAIPALTFQFR